VPTNLQASLSARLKLLIEYQSTQQWEKHYDLLFFTFTQGISREEYIKYNRHWYTNVVPDDLILNFIPKATKSHELSEASGWWTIYGCAKLRKAGSVVSLYASVDAYRDRGDWYFSSVGVIAPVDGKPKICSCVNEKNLQTHGSLSSKR
jgi:hypothetical protein